MQNFFAPFPLLGSSASFAEILADREVGIMMQQIHNGTRSTSLPPVYADDLTRMIGVLQQIQALMATWNDPTLADVTRLVLTIQQDFGPGESLEHVIQSLVGRNLKRQVLARRLAHQHTEAREVLV